MSNESAKKERKPKASKAQTHSARREVDRQRRRQRRNRTEQRQKEHRIFRFRVKVVRMYSQLREQGSEKAAIERTVARWQPTELDHCSLSASTVRGWYRTVQAEGYGALRPKSRRPHTIHYQVPEWVVGVIFTLRTHYGWGGHRIAAELKERQIWSLCGQSVYQIFNRLGLSVKGYALCGKSDGIAYQRYAATRPNAQWHIDLKQTHLSDGATVYICVLIDDYSRCAIAAVAGLHKSTEWVAQVARQAVRCAGTPHQIVSDNGREFCSVWQESLTQFGRLLGELGIDHRTTAPYYPQANGKVEAFNKILAYELLERQTFASLTDLQLALDHFLTYYNNYRLHSALGWQPPISRYTGRRITLRGLAALPGLEPMASQPLYPRAAADPPIPITPTTASYAFALALPVSICL
jgi:transposase InsO family protein